MPAQASRLRRILGTAPLHEGIGLNFVTNRFYTRAPGSGANNAPFTTLFPFTGGNQSLYRGASGLLVQSVTNTPRIEYDLGGTVLGFLSEASRTNICLQSDDLTTTWAATNATVSANAIAGPTGAVIADKLQEDAATAVHFTQQSPIVITAGATYTYTTFAKAAENNFFQIGIDNGAANGGYAVFNLTTGVVTQSANKGTGTGISASITPYSNGYYRCSITTVVDAASIAGRVFDVLCISGTPGFAPSYLGVAGNGVYCAGAQLEAGAFASSYIPTTTVSIARTADVSTRTLGAEFSATQGTVVVTGRASPGQDAALNQVLWSFDDGTAANRIQFRRPPAADTAQFLVLVASVQQFSLTGTYSNSTNFKEASAWALNDFALSFNGAAPTTAGAGTLPTVTALGLGNFTSASQAYGHIKTFDYYPTRLDNATLQRLST